MSLTSELGKYRQGQRAGEQAAYQTCLRIVEEIEFDGARELLLLDDVHDQIEVARQEADK